VAFAVKAGVVNDAPVAMEVPPVAWVYQLNVVPGAFDVAVNAIVLPAHNCASITATLLIFMIGLGMITSASKRSRDDNTLAIPPPSRS
jgi:hypothetical protein